jgi:hypothetical protein
MMGRPSSARAAKALTKLRAICLAMPSATERLSHGEPTWFVEGKRVFAMFSDHHHDDRVGFVCPAPDGAQELLVQGEPGRFYVPPYVGHRGWLGVRLDVAGVDWVQIADLVEAGYREVAPRRLLGLL